MDPKKRGGKRKGGHERETESKRKALEKEAAKCRKITELFRPPPPPLPSSSVDDDAALAATSEFKNATPPMHVRPPRSQSEDQHTV